MQPYQLPKTLAKWARIISEVSDERRDDDGYWIYLIPGLWSPEDETHCIHEDTPTLCRRKLKTVTKCNCCPGDWDAFWTTKVRQVGAKAAYEQKALVEKILS